MSKKSYPLNQYSLGDILRLVRLIGFLLDHYRADSSYIPTKGELKRLGQIRERLDTEFNAARALYHNMGVRYEIGRYNPPQKKIPPQIVFSFLAPLYKKCAELVAI